MYRNKSTKVRTHSLANELDIDNLSRNTEMETHFFSNKTKHSTSYYAGHCKRMAEFTLCLSPSLYISHKDST
jgi:hypothetical protein